MHLDYFDDKKLCITVYFSVDLFFNRKIYENITVCVIVHVSTLNAQVRPHLTLTFEACNVKTCHVWTVPKMYLGTISQDNKQIGSVLNKALKDYCYKFFISLFSLKWFGSVMAFTVYIFFWILMVMLKSMHS